MELLPSVGSLLLLVSLSMQRHLSRSRAQEVAGVVQMVDTRVGEDCFFIITIILLSPVVESRVQTRGRGRTGGERRALTLPLTLINVRNSGDQDGVDDDTGNVDDE